MSTESTESDEGLLAIQIVTRFTVADSGALISENDPAGSPAPRLYLAGCRTGNVVRLRHDVDEGIVRAVQALAVDEPPLCRSDSLPVHAADYAQLLGTQAPVERTHAGLIWTFPKQFTHRSRVALVGSGTAEGDRLLAHIAERGMPEPLLALGFVGVDDFWAPWSAALDGEEIASIAFSARLGPAGAEAGVVTVPPLRGRGYAAAATAGWASLPAQRGRVLFYSALRTNVSSHGVAQRLGLRLLGASLTIT
jgi:hypothetical protein